MDRELSPVDPLDFVDKKSYKKRVEEGEKKTGRASSAVGGNRTDRSAQPRVIFLLRRSAGTALSRKGVGLSS